MNSFDDYDFLLYKDLGYVTTYIIYNKIYLLDGWMLSSERDFLF